MPSSSDALLARQTGSTSRLALRRAACARRLRGDQPGYKGGGNKFDLDRWDESYFRRLRDFDSRLLDIPLRRR